MFTDDQKARLKKAVRMPADYTMENPELDAVIAQIRLESPHAFLTKDDLKLRRFIVNPQSSIPYKHDD